VKNIRYSKKFKKQYQKLSPKLRQKAKNQIALWQDNPHDTSLRTHRLSGKMSRFYSIDITSDVRALYEVIGGETYLYQIVGTHSQLYG
jgi:addiction module RelE/StbE family toxin